ncbi:Major facilitator superfamily domain- general substrate transporter [Apiospora phragmitis]|uniref:Major facilitator superfamily domain- general substrate transporter n=1 Tax=Apiospora phragmitis TaxID=2905665 RepID=A0ABR1UQZ7_9PEZI
MAARYDDTGTMPSLDRADSMEERLNSSSANRSHHYGQSLSPLRQTVLVAILLLGLLFSSLDASIVSTSLVSISVELKGFITVPWVALSYLLAYLGFAVAFSKLSDIYGRRALIQISWLLFGAFSLGCGLAQNMTQLHVFHFVFRFPSHIGNTNKCQSIVCRAFQGIGGSGLYSLAQIGLFEVGPTHNPGLLGALIGMTLAVSFVLGPVLGGTISHLATWRWIFFINIPFSTVALAGIMLAWPSRHGSRSGVAETYKKLDLPGILLVMGGSTLLVFALQQAGSFNMSWDSPVIVATLTIATLCWVVFVAWEYFLEAKYYMGIQALFSSKLVALRPYMAALVFMILTGFIYLAIIIILPERFQIINEQNSLMAGIHLLPMLGACAFGSFLAGAISSKRNNTSPTLIAAACLQLIGVGLLSTFSDVDSAVQPQYGYQAIFGLGVGLTFAAATMLTSVHVDHGNLAVAQGAIAQARVFGGAIGIAVCSLVFNHRAKDKLAGHLTPADLQTLQQSPVIGTLFTPDAQKMIRSVYAAAFVDDIKIFIYLSAAGVVASLFTFQRHPPPMPRVRRANKEDSETPRGALSETELEDMSHHRR